MSEKRHMSCAFGLLLTLLGLGLFLAFIVEIPASNALNAPMGDPSPDCMGNYCVNKVYKGSKYLTDACVEAKQGEPKTKDGLLTKKCTVKKDISCTGTCIAPQPICGHASTCEGKPVKKPDIPNDPCGLSGGTGCAQAEPPPNNEQQSPNSPEESGGPAPKEDANFPGNKGPQTGLEPDWGKYFDAPDTEFPADATDPPQRPPSGTPPSGPPGGLNPPPPGSPPTGGGGGGPNPTGGGPQPSTFGGWQGEGDSDGRGKGGGGGGGDQGPLEKLKEVLKDNTPNFDDLKDLLEDLKDWLKDLMNQLGGEEEANAPTPTPKIDPDSDAEKPQPARKAVTSTYGYDKGSGDSSKQKLANGQYLHQQPWTAACKTCLLGTKMQFCNGSRCVVVTMRDRGPYVAGREFDLARRAAEAIGMVYGVSKLDVTPVPSNTPEGPVGSSGPYSPPVAAPSSGPGGVGSDYVAGGSSPEYSGGGQSFPDTGFEDINWDQYFSSEFAGAGLGETEPPAFEGPAVPPDNPQYPTGEEFAGQPSPGEQSYGGGPNASPEGLDQNINWNDYMDRPWMQDVGFDANPEASPPLADEQGFKDFAQQLADEAKALEKLAEDLQKWTELGLAENLQAFEQQLAENFQKLQDMMAESLSRLNDVLKETLAQMQAAEQAALEQLDQQIGLGSGAVPPEAERGISGISPNSGGDYQSPPDHNLRSLVDSYENSGAKPSFHGVYDDQGRLYAFSDGNREIPVNSPDGEQIAQYLGCTGTCYENAVNEAEGARPVEEARAYGNEPADTLAEQERLAEQKALGEDIQKKIDEAQAAAKTSKITPPAEPPSAWDQWRYNIDKYLRENGWTSRQLPGGSDVPEAQKTLPDSGGAQSEDKTPEQRLADLKAAAEKFQASSKDYYDRLLDHVSREYADPNVRDPRLDAAEAQYRADKAAFQDAYAAAKGDLPEDLAKQLDKMAEQNDALVQKANEAAAGFDKRGEELRAWGEQNNKSTIGEKQGDQNVLYKRDIAPGGEKNFLQDLNPIYVQQTDPAVRYYLGSQGEVIDSLRALSASEQNIAGTIADGINFPGNDALEQPAGITTSPEAQEQPADITAPPPPPPEGPPPPPELGGETAPRTTEGPCATGDNCSPDDGAKDGDKAPPGEKASPAGKAPPGPGAKTPPGPTGGGGGPTGGGGGGGEQGGGSGGGGGGFEGILGQLMQMLQNFFKTEQQKQEEQQQQQLQQQQQQPQQTPPAIASLIARPSSVKKGDRTRLIWGSVYTTSCIVFDDLSNEVARGTSDGAATTTPLFATTRFTVTCQVKDKPSVSARATVTVSSGPTDIQKNQKTSMQQATTSQKSATTTKSTQQKKIQNTKPKIIITPVAKPVETKNTKKPQAACDPGLSYWEFIKCVLHM